LLLKYKTIFLLIFLLAATPWLAAQHAVWWDGSPPPGNTAKDHSIGYGYGFAWQVALGTATSWDWAHDVIAVSNGGYLVVGSNGYTDGSHLTHADLALYRLDEDGNLVWEKLYAIDNYKEMNEFKAVEKPDGGFLVAGKLSWGGVGVPRRCILLNCDTHGDTLSTRKWTFADMATDDFKLIKSTFDESYFISYYQNFSGSYLTEVVKLNYNLDTLSICTLPHYWFVPKPFGYIHRGNAYENVFYYYIANHQGVALDSFPDPMGPISYWQYPIQLVNNDKNVFFKRNIQGLPRILKMAITDNTGEVLVFNDNCFSSDYIYWISSINRSTEPYQALGGSFIFGLNWYFDYYDNDAIGLVKLNSHGEHIGDTALTRYDGSMWLSKVSEGGDGRVLVFGRGENGPIGDMDIFIAKLETWNPVSVLTPNETGTLPLKVYPNPVGQTVTVELPQGARGTLSIVTLPGLTVHSQPVTANGAQTLSAAKWPSGLLIVTLTTPNGVFTTKLIKN
jgi:hypothetical protein